MSLRNQIPAFYWYYGTLFDPLFSISAIYMSYFQPSLCMDPGFAHSSPYGKISPSHMLLVHQFGGTFAAWAFLHLTIPPRNQQYESLDAVPALAFTDVAVLFSQVKALEAQGRLALGMLRWEESSNAVIVAVILAIRVGFVAGVGFNKTGAKKRNSIAQAESRVDDGGGDLDKRGL
jgi:hypothetical protein